MTQDGPQNRIRVGTEIRINIEGGTSEGNSVGIGGTSSDIHRTSNEVVVETGPSD